MSRYGILVTCLLAGALSTSVADAAIKFTDASAFATDGNLSPASLTGTSSTPPVHGGLFVTFKEVGLGSNEGTLYRVTADASATYGCVNGGNQHPNATNKETVSGPVQASATFTSGKNGSVSGSIAVAPLAAGSFSCPAGQTLALIAVSYTNVVLTDLTNNISVSIPGTFSLTLVP